MFKERLDLQITGRKNIVLYNPKRKYKIHSEADKKRFFYSFCGNRKYDAYAGNGSYGRSQSCALILVPHPGKDRMPREAALLGCCILTSTLGSADFFDDVPIMSEYKFEEDKPEYRSVFYRKYIIF